MDIFQAGVQYNDFEGSVAADKSDTKALIEFLKQQGLANEAERLVGIRIAFNENAEREIHSPGVVAYLVESEEFVQTPESVRAVEIDIPIAILFSFFKRFDLVMTKRAMDLSKAHVDGPH